MTPRPFIRLHPDDNIAVASRHTPLGTSFGFDPGQEIFSREAIDMGHKIALRPIELGFYLPGCLACPAPCTAFDPARPPPSPCVQWTS